MSHLEDKGLLVCLPGRVLTQLSPDRGYTPMEGDTRKGGPLPPGVQKHGDGTPTAPWLSLVGLFARRPQSPAPNQHTLIQTWQDRDVQVN